MLSSDMQFILDKDKLPFLTWRPGDLTPWVADIVIDKCVQNK